MGNDGNDTLDGGTGADTLLGGAGNDTYVVDGATDVVVENPAEGTADTVVTSLDYQIGDEVENLSLIGTAMVGVGNGLSNVITGNASANILVADAGDDTVYGGEGADEIYGQEGDDSLYSSTLANPTDTVIDVLVGGPGNDTYYIGSSNDVVIEWSGQGTDTVVVNSPSGHYLANNVENLTLQGNTPFGVGNALDNLITGNDQGNFLIGGEGQDTLVGGGGTDMLVGGTGNDLFRISLGTGLDIIGDFETGADQLDLSAYGFAFYAGLAATQWKQQGQDALLDLGGGNVALLVGVDLVTLASETTPGGTVASLIIGTAGADTVDAGAGNDVIVAGAGNDSLLGSEGDDMLGGGEGNDTVTGGIGADTFTGGNGADVLIISTPGHSGLMLTTADRITDFATGSDLLRLGVAGTANNYSEASSAVADFEAALTAATAALAALDGGSGGSDAQLYNFQFDAINGYLFIDRNSDGVADEVIVLVGIDNTEIVHTDIGGP